MGEREFEDRLRQVLQQDFPAGTEEFRDALLARCLAELNAGRRVIELDDSELELLAAAGCLPGAEEQLLEGGEKPR